MTKEEIIHRLQYARHRIDNITYAPDVLKAIDIAIETVGNTDADTISRRAAIDILHEALDAADQIAYVPFGVYQNYRDKMNELPPAQPEIIRCRNCKFASGDSRICMKFGHSPIGELDFCAWAERRTDE